MNDGVSKQTKAKERQNESEERDSEGAVLLLCESSAFLAVIPELSACEARLGPRETGMSLYTPERDECFRAISMAIGFRRWSSLWFGDALTGSSGNLDWTF